MVILALLSRTRGTFCYPVVTGLDRRSQNQSPEVTKSLARFLFVETALLCGKGEGRRSQRGLQLSVVLVIWMDLGPVVESQLIVVPVDGLVNPVDEVGRVDLETSLSVLPTTLVDGIGRHEKVRA